MGVGDPAAAARVHLHGVRFVWCYAGIVVPGNLWLRVLKGGISASGEVDPEQQDAHLAELLDSDQLVYRRHAVLTRRKRNLLFPSGVKLCTQETFDQAAANHLTFFQQRGKLLFSFISFTFPSHIWQNFTFSTISPLTPEVLLI